MGGKVWSEGGCLGGLWGLELQLVVALLFGGAGSLDLLGLGWRGARETWGVGSRGEGKEGEGGPEGELRRVGLGGERGRAVESCCAWGGMRGITTPVGERVYVVPQSKI